MKDKLENNYEYKVIKRIIMKEFPFITNIDVNEEDLEKYNYIIPLILTIDPNKVTELYGWELADWYKKLISNEGYQTSYLSIPYNVSQNEVDRVITRPIKELFDSIRNTQAIPSNIRLSPSRIFTLETYIIPKTSV